MSMTTKMTTPETRSNATYGGGVLTAIVHMDKVVELELRKLEQKSATLAALGNLKTMNAARYAVEVLDRNGFIETLSRTNASHDFVQTVAEIAVRLHVRARYEMARRVRRAKLEYWGESQSIISASLSTAVRQAGRAAQTPDPIEFLTTYSDAVSNGKTRALTLFKMP